MYKTMHKPTHEQAKNQQPTSTTHTQGDENLEQSQAPVTNPASTSHSTHVTNVDEEDDWDDFFDGDDSEKAG